MTLPGFSRLSTALFATALLTAASLPALAAGPFDALNGSWSGNGTVHPQGGSAERIRCTASYKPSGRTDVTVNLRCASDSYNFELQSNAVHSNGTVSGNWSENTRRVGGSIEGSGNASTIRVRVSGIISASLALNTIANQQSISIQAPGTEMQNVAISLSRK